ncbi:MAG: ABC transporter substrate-binding protein [Actinobacteria bacterium]|jgi:branched-chain amino acid transport system substrate-binding protein|nr:ABC transporter substrate-binding protein [Actinomycetota bacterium]
MPDEETRETKDEGLQTAKVVSRREFLKYAGIAGAAVAVSGGLGGVLAACGDDEPTTTTAGPDVTEGPTTTAGTGPTDAPTTTVQAGPEPPAQDTIRIGAARPISGANAIFEEAHFGPAYKLWVEDVNAAGGVDVAGKKMPVEMIVYDDQSDMDQSMRLITKLIEEDKVDFLFSPCSTAFQFAAAGVANAHNFLLLSSEGGATTLENEMKKGSLPLYFQLLNYSNHVQMPVFAELCAELGVKTVSICYIDDLHGIEYQAQAQIELAGRDIEVLSNVPVPPGIKDVTTIVKQWQSEAADMICSFQYPPENILTISTLMQLNYNPKGILVGPGGPTQAVYDIWQGAADQYFFEGAWTYEQSPEVKAYYEKLAAFVGGPANVDFWGSLIYKAQMELFQQAIERAASLDHQKIAEVLRTEHFKTLMSDDTFFTNQLLDASSYSGQIGQWQNGVPHVVDPGPKRTAEPIYPKIPWGSFTVS